MNYFAHKKALWKEESGDLALDVEEQAPLTDEELDRIESAFQCQLPTEYREFLKIFGVEYAAFYMEFDYELNDSTIVGQIRLFYGYSRDPKAPGYDHTRDVIQWNLEFQPEKADEVICIGDDPGGYQICLCVHGEHFGSVYIWDRSKAWEAKGLHDLFFVANNFAEFVNMLRIVH